MTVLVVYPDAGTGGTTVDGFVQRGAVNETFSTIIGGAGRAADDTGATFWLGLWASATTNQFATNNRGIMTFDTSSLGTGADVSTVVLSIKTSAKSEGLGSHDFHICSSAPANSNELVITDYSQLGTTSFANIAYTSVSTVDYNNYTLDANGISNVSKTGISEFGMKNSWDMNSSFTGTWGSSKNSFYLNKSADSTGTTDDPKLTITYTADSAPTVTTQAATSVEENQAVLNGNITGLGTEDVTEWGFYYKEGAGTPTSSDTVISSTGTASTGAYTETPTGLKDNTLYSAIAFATNSVGTDTGDVIQFTTLEEATGNVIFFDTNF